MASVSIAGRLSREGRSGLSARCTAQATSGRVTSWSSSPCRCSIRPWPRRLSASTLAARATAPGDTPRISAASAVVSPRLSAKQSASSGSARSSASASGVPGGTTARPKTSISTSSSSATGPGHRDGPERLLLLHGCLAALQQLEQTEEAGHRLEPAGDTGEEVVEEHPAASQPAAQLGHLVLHRERDGAHRERLGLGE